MKTKIEIKSIFGNVLFELEKENNTVKDTLIEAVKQHANLNGANLHGADLHGADLGGANLNGAYLDGANLRGANLGGADLGGADLGGVNLGGADLNGANLYGAYLDGANLRGANLGGADLGGAYLDGANLRGANLGGANFGNWGKIQPLSDILIIGAIGSRSGYTTILLTDKGIFVQCGCFRGTLDEFEAEVKETHQGNKYERDYLAMIEFVKIKFSDFKNIKREETK